MEKRARLALAITMALALLAGAGGLALASETRDCYRGGDDPDNDGYARSGASIESTPVRNSEKLNCPKGWVRKEKDCQANNREIHPRRPEVPNNRIDDNCDDRIDEPEFVYLHENRDNWVTPNSFRLRLKLNDSRLYSPGRRLHVRFRLTDLTDMNHPANQTISNVQVQNQGGTRFANLTVSGLRPETVYRVDQVQFLDAATSTALGDSTDEDTRYYTTTDGASPEAQRRTAILLRGFKEYGESQMGKVGYWGSEYKDGTKYGARKGELWCSEFYAWVTKPYLEGIANRGSVSSLRRFFRQRNQYSLINTGVLTRARRGDYVSMDINDDKKKDHSGMFLAYDAAAGRVWLLEGNTSGNTVDVKDRAPGDVDGLGHITSAMPLSNHQACKQWCDANPGCVKCSTKVGCGPGYRLLRSYTGPGTNYHACAELSRSRGNREACEEWCRSHAECAKCDTNVGCGVGYKNIRSWTKGGTNWYACEELSRSADHRQACEEWCRAHSECAKCDTKIGCGVGYKRLRSWTGRGTNWHACERR